jgi:hypothetical protein
MKYLNMEAKLLDFIGPYAPTCWCAAALRLLRCGCRQKSALCYMPGLSCIGQAVPWSAAV